MSTIKISTSRLDLGTNRLDNALLKDCGEIKTAPTISAGTLTLDISAGNVFEVSLNANVTTLSITNVIATGTAQSFTLVFTADGTARTVTWGNSVAWPAGTAPTLTSTSGQKDFLTFYTSTGGITWYGFVTGQNFAPILSPVNTVAPTVSDTAPYVGETLTATSGTWTGTATITYTYQWQHGTTNISGATSITYVVDGAYVGETIRVVVTASNGILPDGTANSASTSAVVAGWFLWAWGQNSTGQGALGINTNTSRSSPVQVGALNDWETLSPSKTGNHVIATKKSGALWGWGKSLQGQVGNNTTVYYSSPVQIGALTNWLLPVTGYNHSGALKTDGTLWMWGFGTSGEIGQNSQASPSSPIQIGARTDWATLSCGQQTSAAITTGGALFTWGNNAVGGTGINVAVGQQSSPTQVGALTNWRYISASSNGHRAVKTDGTLWGWGDNALGQVGDGTVVVRSSPVQIGALTNWTPTSGANGFASSTNRNFHVKSDGTMWGWGKDYIGGLGLNTNYVNRSSPTQIGALTNWLTAAAGYMGGASLKTDGTYWIWGYYTAPGGENGGAYSTNTLNDHGSSPVQLGARTDWTQVKRGSGWSMGLTSNA